MPAGAAACGSAAPVVAAGTVAVGAAAAVRLDSTPSVTTTGGALLQSPIIY